MKNQRGFEFSFTQIRLVCREHGEVFPKPSSGNIQDYGSRSQVNSNHMEACSTDTPADAKRVGAFLGWKIMFPIFVFFIGDIQWGMIESQLSYFDVKYLGIAPKGNICSSKLRINQQM